MNHFGHLFSITTFGESHGPAMGVVVDGMPSGIELDFKTLQIFLERRRPGGRFVSSRSEPDLPEILSGVYQGRTLGTPLALVFKNQAQRSKDYAGLNPRKGHADQAWLDKFSHVDLRGGGRSSGRETLGRVAGGAFAKMALAQSHPSLQVHSFTKSIFNICEASPSKEKLVNESAGELGFLDPEKEAQAKRLLLSAKEQGESYGGRIEVRAYGVPASLGQPVFNKVKSRLAEAILSVGAVKSFSLGCGVDLSKVPGTRFHEGSDSVYGGVSGGITTGAPLIFTAEIKPTASILDVAKKGRHDPCIVPRVRVVLEAMVWLVLMDLSLFRKVEVQT